MSPDDLQHRVMVAEVGVLFWYFLVRAKTTVASVGVIGGGVWLGGAKEFLDVSKALRLPVK